MSGELELIVACEPAGPLVRGVIAAFAGLVPPTVVAVLAESAGRPPGAVVPLLAGSAMLAAIAGQRWLNQSGRARARERIADAGVTALAVAGVLIAVAPPIAVVVAMLVLAGDRAGVTAAARRAAGVAAIEPQLARVEKETVAFADAARRAGGHDRAAGARLRHLAAVDGFADTFASATSRATRWSRLEEVLLAPVSLVAVVMLTSVSLGLSRHDALVCSLFVPCAGDAVMRFRERTRPAPVMGARAVRLLAAQLWHLRRGRVATLAAPAVRSAVPAALLHGAALALAAMWLTTPSHVTLPWGLAVAVAAVVHAVLLARSATLAQQGGADTLRMLSHAVAAKIATARPEQLGEPHVKTLVMMATRDVVVASGLVVHGLRPGVAAVLVPCGAVLAAGGLLLCDIGQVPRLLPFLALGCWLAGCARSAGSAASDLRRGIQALARLR